MPKSWGQSPLNFYLVTKSVILASVPFDIFGDIPPISYMPENLILAKLRNLDSLLGVSWKASKTNWIGIL